MVARGRLSQGESGWDKARRLSANSTGWLARRKSGEVRAENDFLDSVRSGEAFVRLQREYLATGQAAPEDLEELLEKVCRACWIEVERQLQAANAANADGSIQEARAEIESLKKQLYQCNLQAMKQISAMKSSIQHASNEAEPDPVMFFEPLKFLDPALRSLVLGIVVEKIQQLEVGDAPDSLVKMLKDYILETGTKHLLRERNDNDLDPGEDAEIIYERWEQEKKKTSVVQGVLKNTEAKLSDAKEQLGKAEVDLKTSEENLDRAKREVALKDSELEERNRRLEEVNRKLAIAEEECDRAQEQAAGLGKQLTKAMDNLTTVVTKQKEAEEVEFKLRRELSGTCAQLKEQIATAASASAEQGEGEHAAELKKALQRIERLEGDRSSIANDLGITKQQLEDLQVEHEELKAELDTVESGAAKLQGNLRRRRSEQRDAGAQTMDQHKGRSQDQSQTEHDNDNEGHSKNATDNAAGVVRADEELIAENKRLKVMLEELKAKLSDLMAEFRKRGLITSDIEKICEDIGLKPLLKAPSIFNRLYQDAVDRVNRLERLRQRYRGSPGPSPEVSPAPRAHHTPCAKASMQVLDPLRMPVPRSPAVSSGQGSAASASPQRALVRRPSVDILSAVQQSDLSNFLFAEVQSSKADTREHSEPPFRQQNEALRDMSNQNHSPAVASKPARRQVAADAAAHQEQQQRHLLSSTTREPWDHQQRRQSEGRSVGGRSLLGRHADDSQDDIDGAGDMPPHHVSSTTSGSSQELMSKLQVIGASTSYDGRPWQQARFPPQWVRDAAATARFPDPALLNLFDMPQAPTASPPPPPPGRLSSDPSRPHEIGGQAPPTAVAPWPSPQQPPPPRLLQHSRMDSALSPLVGQDPKRLQAPPVVTWVLDNSPGQAGGTATSPFRADAGDSQCRRSRRDFSEADDDGQENDGNPVASHMRKLHQSEPTLPVLSRTQVGRFPGFTPSRMESSRSQWR